MLKQSFLFQVKIIFALLVLFLLTVFTTGCNSAATPVAEKQPDATQEVVATATTAPTDAPKPTATHTASPTPKPTATNTPLPPTNTPTATATSTPKPTATHTASPTPKPPTPTATLAATDTPVAAAASPPPAPTSPPQVSAPDSSAATVHWASGRELMDQGNWEAAIEALNKALQADPDFPLAHRDLGICYYQIEDYAQTVSHLERYLELQPDDPERADIEKVIQDLKALTEHNVNPDQGLLVITNYVGGKAVVDVAGQSYEIPGTDEVPDGAKIYVPLAPGHYTASVNGYTQKGERFYGDIEIDIAAGQVLQWPLYFNPE